MSNSRVPLKDPKLAAFLGFLVPGAGHLYQGRTFKGLLYFVCIMGTFLYGLSLGQWQVVYLRWDSTQRTFGYLSQVMVGLPALPAIIQNSRYTPPPAGREAHLQWATSLESPLTAPFKGEIHNTSLEGPAFDGLITGEIELETITDRFGPQIHGTLKGKLEDGTAISLSLSGADIQPRIFGSRRRELSSTIVESRQGRKEPTGHITGSVPRRFPDWFQVPLETKTLEDLNGELGKRFELALVYTWIAGLLNILAFWDALEGPAYGYGDEEEDQGEDEKASSPPRSKPQTPDATLAAAQ